MEQCRLTFLRENQFGGLGYGASEEPKKKPSKHFDAQFRAYGGKEPSSESLTNFCTWLGIPHQIRYATFGDDRLRGFCVDSV